MVTTEAQMQAIQEAEDIDAGVDTRSKKEMIGDQMSAFSSTAKTAAEMAPVVGDAIAVYNLPSDLRKAYELIQQGYTEGDIKDIGLGAGLAGLSALGVVPVLGAGAKVAKKGLRQTIDEALVQTEDLFRTASGMDGPDSMAMATTSPSRVTGNVADDALPDTSITKIIIGKSGKDHAEKEARYNAAKQQLTGGRSVEPDEAQELWNRTGAQEDLVHGDVVYEIPTVNARLKEDELTKTVFPEMDFSKKKDQPDDKRVFKFEAAPDAQITVGEIVDFPELFEQAPYLKDITVKEVPIMSQLKGTNAAYDDVENILYLSAGTKKDLMSSTLHELEHAVQNADGFTYRGSSLNNFLGPDTGYDASHHKALIDMRKQVAADLNQSFGRLGLYDNKYRIIDTMKMLSDVYSPKLRKRFIQIIEEMDERKIKNLRNSDVKDFKASLPEHVRDVGKSLSDFDYRYSLEFLKKATNETSRLQKRLQGGKTKPPLELLLDTIRAPDFQDLTRFDELKQQAVIKYMRDPGEVTARNVQFRFLASQADPSITRVAPRFTEDKSISPGGGQSRSGIPETKTAEQLREEVSRQGVDLTPTGTYISRPDELALMKGRSATEQTDNMISVFPKPERMFPEGERPKGGDYVNEQTGDVLSGRNVSSANIKINPDGRPSFRVSDDDVSEVGSTGKGKSNIKVNLFKKKAGWKWEDAPDEFKDIGTLISVEHKGKHFYTLETDFSKGVALKKYPDSKSEPRLRPTVVGNIEIEDQVGSISVRGKQHPVYGKIITYAKGGAVPMDRQMDMFEEGGLKDEGGTIDPVSGNDVPPGSTQEEVRDDIPAQLSEGEFVFPADVVRYIGLEKLMQMRQEAKMGLAMMERMGQMGNSEEAVVPDDIPFDLSDLDMDDDLEYNVGGFVPATQQQQQFGISGFTPAAAPTTGVAPAPVQAASAEFARPQQAYVPVATQQPTSFTTFLGPGVPQVDYEFGTFRNEAGQTIQLKIKKGSKGELLPGEVLPEGYVYVDPTTTATEAVTTTPTTGQTTSVRNQDDTGREDRDAARQKALEDQFGKGGATARLGLKDFFGQGQDYIYGVNYLDGVSLPQVLSGNIPDDAKIMLKNGKDEIILTGAEYKIMSEEVKAPGTDYTKTREIIADARKREAEEAREARKFGEIRDAQGNIRMVSAEEERRDTEERASKFTESLKENNLVVGNRGQIEVKAGATEAEKAQAQKAFNDYVASMATDDDEDDGPSGTSYSLDSSGSSSSSSSSSGDISRQEADRQDPRGESAFGGGFRAKGGLIDKPKPKAKKMKRGGLASRK